MEEKTNKPAAKKTSAAKKTTATKKTTTKKVAKKEEVKAVEPVKEDAIAPVVEEIVKPEVKEEIVKPEEIKPEREVIKPGLSISIPTIILAITTIVLAIILIINQPKSTIDLTETFPDIFTETTAAMKMPKGYMFSNDSLEMFKKENGLLTAKGMITAATYTEDEFAEMKEVFVESYGATEVEKEGYQVLNIIQESEDDSYVYYFIYKDQALVQIVLLNCSESEISTILNGISF